MFVGEFGEHEMVLPLAGDFEIAEGVAFLAKADAPGEGEARGVGGDDVGLDAVE